jgi:hypothetical protein
LFLFYVHDSSRSEPLGTLYLAAVFSLALDFVLEMDRAPPVVRRWQEESTWAVHFFVQGSLSWKLTTKRKEVAVFSSLTLVAQICTTHEGESL